MANLKKQQIIIIPDDWLSKIICKPVYHLKQFSTNFEIKDLPKMKYLFGLKFQLMILKN